MKRRALIQSKELAEGVGFEPTVRINRTPVFKTGALNRSAILPCRALQRHEQNDII
jgi:hypothetical protein